MINLQMLLWDVGFGVSATATVLCILAMMLLIKVKDDINLETL